MKEKKFVWRLNHDSILMTRLHRENCVVPLSTSQYLSFWPQSNSFRSGKSNPETSNDKTLLLSMTTFSTSTNTCHTHETAEHGAQMSVHENLRDGQSWWEFLSLQWFQLPIPIPIIESQLNLNNFIQIKVATTGPYNQGNFKFVWNCWAWIAMGGEANDLQLQSQWEG